MLPMLIGAGGTPGGGLWRSGGVVPIQKRSLRDCWIYPALVDRTLDSVPNLPRPEGVVGCSVSSNYLHDAAMSSVMTSQTVLQQFLWVACHGSEASKTLDGIPRPVQWKKRHQYPDEVGLRTVGSESQRFRRLREIPRKEVEVGTFSAH